MKPGLKELENVVIVPHLGSATIWTRQGMATLAAANVAGILLGYPVWQYTDIGPFLGKDLPRAAPSIVNAKELGLPPLPVALEGSSVFTEVCGRQKSP